MKNVIFATKIPKRVIPKDYGPGPSTFLAGNDTLGYMGEIPMNSFVNVAQVSSLVGLSRGDVLGTTSGWLKCVDNGKVLFIAKAALREDAQWGTLNGLGIVFGTKVITILGRQFKVRLLTGGNGDPSSAAGGEWDRLMYPLCVTRPAGTPILANFSEAILGLGSTTDGRANLVQEKAADGKMIIRGYPGLKGYGSGTNIGSNGNIFGWRPVLELIP
jgi:hypothetical protein